MNVKRIRCADIRPDRDSPRYPRQQIELLAESIRRHGILRPVLLRAVADGYVIVHGVLRWHAALLLGLKEIPAFIVQTLEREEAVAA